MKINHKKSTIWLGFLSLFVFGMAQAVQKEYNASLSALSNGTGIDGHDMGVQDVDLTIMGVEVSVSDTGGADHFIVPQAPSQGLLTATVDFSFLGDILVEDRSGLQDTVRWHNH